MVTVYLADSLSSLSHPHTEKLYFCMSDKHKNTIVTTCTILIGKDLTLAMLGVVVKEHKNNVHSHICITMVTQYNIIYESYYGLRA